MAKLNDETPSPFTDVAGNIRRGIEALGSPLPPPSVRELTRDPFSEVTRKERRALLALSVLGIVVGRTGMVPEKIVSIGVTFTADRQTWALYVLAAVTAYFLCVFFCYSTLDYIASRAARAADVENKLNETKSVMLPHRKLQRGLILTRRLRTALDFWLPLALGVWAIVEVIVKSRHL